MAMAMALTNEQTKKIKSFESPRSLPTDILVGLFLSLPLRSLLRCKSVCKLWNSLLSDPHFIKSHYRLSQRRVIFIALPKLDFKSFSPYDVLFDKSVNVDSLEPDYPLKDSPKTVSIVGSCMGLLCIVIDDDNLFILNPNTRRLSNRLPNCDLGIPPNRIVCRGFQMYGFGYDESSYDYKVEQIFSENILREYYKLKVRIYSLKTGKWKHISDFPHNGAYVYSCTFSNGAYHWMVKLYDSLSPLRIISLDLETETYGEVLQPVHDDETNKSFFLGTLGESVYMVCSSYGIRADVWAMKVYGIKDSWTKLLSISYRTKTYFLVRPFFISNDGRVLLRIGRELSIYDSENNSFNLVGEVYQTPYTFVESLVSPIHLQDNNDDVN